jgi:hypothetical protein
MTGLWLALVALASVVVGALIGNAIRQRRDQEVLAEAEAKAKR